MLPWSKPASLAQVQREWLKKHPSAATAPRDASTPPIWVGPSPAVMLDALAGPQELALLAWWQYGPTIAQLFSRLGASYIEALTQPDEPSPAATDFAMHFHGKAAVLRCHAATPGKDVSRAVVERFAVSLPPAVACAYFVSTGLIPYEAKTSLSMAQVPVYMLDSQWIWTAIAKARSAERGALVQP